MATAHSLWRRIDVTLRVVRRGRVHVPEEARFRRVYAAIRVPYERVIVDIRLRCRRSGRSMLANRRFQGQRPSNASGCARAFLDPPSLQILFVLPGPNPEFTSYAAESRRSREVVGDGTLRPGGPGSVRS